MVGQSGDQGGDLLSSKGTRSLIVQCKFYQAKVGNAAVQQVIAARPMYPASLAAVVAPSGFTRQACEIAHRASVFLLSPDQLELLG